MAQGQSRQKLVKPHLNGNKLTMGTHACPLSDRLGKCKIGLLSGLAQALSVTVSPKEPDQEGLGTDSSGRAPA
jgi:hypothetical protein